MMIDGPYVNSMEGPYNIRAERPYLRTSCDAVAVDRDPGSVESQVRELAAGIEELANQISSLRSRLDPVIAPHPERSETMPPAPASTPLGQRLAEANCNLRIQVLRLAIITDNLGL